MSWSIRSMKKTFLFANIKIFCINLKLLFWSINKKNVVRTSGFSYFAYQFVTYSWSIKNIYYSIFYRGKQNLVLSSCSKNKEEFVIPPSACHSIPSFQYISGNCEHNYFFLVVRSNRKWRVKSGKLTKIFLRVCWDLPAGAYLSEAQNPIPQPCILYTCIQYTYSHREGGWGWSWTREKVRGATVHKAGSKITCLTVSLIYKLW